MSVLQRLRSRFTGKGVFQVIRPEHKTIPAFISGGTQYNQFEDPFNAPCLRALTALDFYEEFRQRVSLEYLEKHTQAVDAILSDPKKINIGELARINRHLKERMKIFNFELAYKLASVVYFDDSESPYVYDFKYGQKKIEKWKKDQTVDSFFLQQPLQQLIPSLTSSEGNLQTFSQAEAKVQKSYLDNLTSILFKAESMAGSRKN